MSSSHLYHFVFKLTEHHMAAAGAMHPENPNLTPHLTPVHYVDPENLTL
jgi:hypothetical protein